MSSVISKTATARDSAKLESMWNEIRHHLEDLRHSLAAEIRNYPTPIPRCDAQFNHLYKQQSRLVRDLDQIGALTGNNAKRGDIIESIRQFVASAPYTDDPAELQLRVRLKKDLSEFGITA